MVVTVVCYHWHNKRRTAPFCWTSPTPCGDLGRVCLQVYHNQRCLSLGRIQLHQTDRPFYVLAGRDPLWCCRWPSKLETPLCLNWGGPLIPRWHHCDRHIVDINQGTGWDEVVNPDLTFMWSHTGIFRLDLLYLLYVWISSRTTARRKLHAYCLPKVKLISGVGWAQKILETLDILDTLNTLLRHPRNIKNSAQNNWVGWVHGTCW
jgi:hypothetical protein